jgi:uncharacterized protein
MKDAADRIVTHYERMMRWARAIALALLAASCGSDASAGSFGWAKASTATEKLIFGDQGLRARDVLMTKLYAAALKQDGAEQIKNKQRRWLVSIRDCSDTGCIVSRYDARLSELMDTKGGQAASKLFFTHSGNGNDGQLAVFGSVDGFAAISITSTYVGPNGAASTSVRRPR